MAAILKRQSKHKYGGLYNNLKKYKHGKCFTYLVTDARREQLRKQYQQITQSYQYDRYDPELEIENFNSESEYFNEVIEAQHPQSTTVQNIVQNICSKMIERYPYPKKSANTEEQEKEFDNITNERINYLNSLFYKLDENGNPLCNTLNVTEVTQFLSDLFRKNNGKGIQMIAALDTTPFIIGYNHGMVYLDTVAMHYRNSFNPKQVVSWAAESKHGADKLQTDTQDFWTSFMEWCDNNLVELLRQNLRKCGLNIK